jgi:predicted enzyme related to lactoylglutathione lyase
MQVQGITWNAVILDEADEFAAMKNLLVEVFGLTPEIDSEGWTMFPMSNGGFIDLYAREALPDYFDDGIVFGFRVDDIEAASAELAEGGCELLGEINRLEEYKYAYRHFRGPDGRVYGLNQQN